MERNPDVSETRCGDKRKDEILTAAAKVFAKRGFSGARMDDIVTESGLSKGLLDWYFKSKDALIVAIMERLLEPEKRFVRELSTMQGSARDRLLLLARNAAKEIDVMKRIVPFTFEFYLLAFRNKSVKKVMRSFLDAYFDCVQRVVEQGISGGELRPVNPREAAGAIASVIEGTFLIWIFDPTQMELSSQIRTGIELIIRGLELSPLN